MTTSSSSKECPKCGTPHLKDGTFCSRKCANSRTWSSATRRKRSASLKKAWKKGIFDGVDFNVKASSEAVSRTAQTKKRMIMETVPFEQLPPTYRKEKLYELYGKKCSRCDLSEWQGEPLVLEMDHINGVRTDNRLDNCRLLCPNCHSMTPTWRARNITYQKSK